MNKKPNAYITFSELAEPMHEEGLIYEIHNEDTQLICALQGRLMTPADLEPTAFPQVADYLLEQGLHTDVPVILVTVATLQRLHAQYAFPGARVVTPSLY